MACIPPCVTFQTPTVAPCPGADPAIPIIPPGVPSFQVCPNNVVVPTVESGQPGPPVNQRKKKCKYVQPARPKSFAPIRKFKAPDLGMEDGTVYRKSYLPFESGKVPPIMPSNNLCVGEGKFTKNTVHKMSFKPHKSLPPCPILPCNHKLLGDGPMQDVTTNKHDYVPKCQKRVEKVPPRPSLFSSDCPLSDKTTNRLSYMPVDTAKLRVSPIRPPPALTKATGPFETNTVQKMSYMPWEMPEKMDMPWAQRNKFRPPTLRMSGDTVNRLSYAPPGVYVECDDDDPSCEDCPETPCNFPSPPVEACTCPRASC